MLIVFESDGASGALLKSTFMALGKSSWNVLSFVTCNSFIRAEDNTVGHFEKKRWGEKLPDRKIKLMNLTR